MDTEKQICLYSKPKWEKHNSFSQKRSFLYRIEENKVFIKEGEFEIEYKLYTNESINALIESSKKASIEITKGFIVFKNNSTRIKTTKEILFRYCLLIGKLSNSEFVNLSFFQSTIDVNFESCHFNNPPKSKIAECLSCNDCTLWNLQFNFCTFVNEVNFSHCKDSDNLSFGNCSNIKGELEGDDINVNKISIRSCEFERLSISTQPIKPDSDLKEFDIDDSKISHISIMDIELDSFNFWGREIGSFLCRGSINSLVFVSVILNDSFTTSLPEKYFKNPFIIKQIKMLDCIVNFPLRLEKFKGNILDLSENSFNNNLFISFDTKDIKQKKPNDTSKNDQNILVLNHSILNKITNIDTTNIDKVFLLNTKNLGYLFLTPNDFILLRDKLDHTGFVKDNDRKKILRNKKSQYLLLCDTYKKNGEFENVDLAWVEYMKVSGKLSKWCIRPFYCFLYVMGRFGTKPSCVVISIFSAWFLFAIIYGLFDKVCFNFINIKNIMFNQEIGSIWNYLYFSVITFLTIGYGDIAPSHLLAKFIAGVEGFLGVFLIAYLTVSIFRKFTRK